MSAPLNNPALLVIDMQNDFVREGAPLECAAARDTIPAIRDLLAGFREQGRPVVFTRYVADAMYRPLGVSMNVSGAMQRCLRPRWSRLAE